MRRNLIRSTVVVGSLWLACLASPAMAQSMHLAPGFTARPAASKLVIVPMDIELFSLSAGGVAEPRADWTEAAQKNFRLALAQQEAVASDAAELEEQHMDELAQINALHGAVAEAVFLHHMLGDKLPTKNNVLDWSLGEAVKPLRDKSQADYALFFWIRDSYASAERKVAIVALALLGVSAAGGTQIGYASPVDLHTGRVVWFNSLLRGTGDLREPKAAGETVEALLRDFPKAQ